MKHYVLALSAAVLFVSHFAFADCGPETVDFGTASDEMLCGAQTSSGKEGETASVGFDSPKASGSAVFVCKNGHWLKQSSSCSAKGVTAEESASE